jgi:hypothetical protein
MSVARRTGRIALLPVVAACAVAGCGGGHSAADRPNPPAASVTSPPGSLPVSSAPAAQPSPPSIPPVPTATGFPDLTAVSCAGNPSFARIVALLHAQHILGQRDVATVRVGPLCAGTWQYTVLMVAGKGPLEVVSRGPASALELVTAGTDVCSSAVRTDAPVGILVVAGC